MTGLGPIINKIAIVTITKQGRVLHMDHVMNSFGVDDRVADEGLRMEQFHLKNHSKGTVAVWTTLKIWKSDLGL